jgi:hypothetical protein
MSRSLEASSSQEPVTGPELDDSNPLSYPVSLRFILILWHDSWKLEQRSLRRHQLLGGGQ